MTAAMVLMMAAGLAAQYPQPLVETGEVTVDGQAVPYEIRHLPLSSFPELPAGIAAQLAARGCLIPQTYQARRPENVVHGALERAGSSDWAVLCSSGGTVTLLVFFESAPETPTVLATALETERLQRRVSGNAMGFNWGIDPASPKRVHEAQTGLPRRPAPPDHDALADSVVDRKTVYHFFARGKWTLVELPAE
jgi:hypothetical protein